jgi:hypothetical protein
MRYRTPATLASDLFCEECEYRADRAVGNEQKPTPLKGSRTPPVAVCNLSRNILVSGLVAFLEGAGL